MSPSLPRPIAPARRPRRRRVLPVVLLLALCAPPGAAQAPAGHAQVDALLARVAARYAGARSYHDRARVELWRAPLGEGRDPRTSELRLGVEREAGTPRWVLEEARYGRWGLRETELLLRSDGLAWPERRQLARRGRPVDALLLGQPEALPLRLALGLHDDVAPLDAAAGSHAAAALFGEWPQRALLPDAALDGRTCRRVELRRAGATPTRTVLWIDPADHTLRRLELGAPEPSTLRARVHYAPVFDEPLPPELLAARPPRRPPLGVPAELWLMPAHAGLALLLGAWLAWSRRTLLGRPLPRMLPLTPLPLAALGLLLLELLAALVRSLRAPPGFPYEFDGLMLSWLLLFAWGCVAAWWGARSTWILPRGARLALRDAVDGALRARGEEPRWLPPVRADGPSSIVECLGGGLRLELSGGPSRAARLRVSGRAGWSARQALRRDIEAGLPDDLPDPLVSLGRGALGLAVLGTALALWVLVP